MHRLRFSPIPTENPDIQTLYLAALTWATARAAEADFILCLDDGAANRQDFSGFFEALEWLGVDWDEGPLIGGDYEPYSLSQRPSPPPELLTLLQSGGLSLANNDPILKSILADRDMEISHSINSESEPDAAQTRQQIYALLGWQAPVNIAVPLLVDGQKRPLPQQGYRTEDFQLLGYLGSALFNYLVLLGWQPESGQEIVDKWHIRQQFSLNQLSDRASFFDWQRLKRINHHYIQRLSDKELALALQPFLEDAYGYLPPGEAWLVRLTALIKPHLNTLEDVVEAAEWALSGDFECSPAALDVLQTEPTHAILSQLVAEVATVVLLDEDTARAIIKGLIQRNSLKNSWQPAEITAPIEAILTGQINRFPLGIVMGLLGKQTILQRAANALQ